jgi:hypothetical protein
MNTSNVPYVHIELFLGAVVSIKLIPLETKICDAPDSARRSRHRAGNGSQPFLNDKKCPPRQTPARDRR